MAASLRTLAGGLAAVLGAAVEGARGGAASGSFGGRRPLVDRCIAWAPVLSGLRVRLRATC